MPIYEYQCKKCNKLHEQWCGFDECKELSVCPNCGETCHRVISNCTFALKGGGWYAGGYNKKKE